VAEAPRWAERHRLHPGGQSYTLITPANYRADQRHVLLLALAPAGMNAALSERCSGLTHTTTGFLIAYADSAGSLQRTTIAPVGEVAEDIARHGVSPTAKCISPDTPTERHLCWLWPSISR